MKVRATFQTTYSLVPYLIDETEDIWLTTIPKPADANEEG